MCRPHTETARLIASLETPQTQTLTIAPDAINPLAFVIAAGSTAELAMEQFLGNTLYPNQVDGWNFWRLLSTKAVMEAHGSSPMATMTEDQILEDRRSYLPILRDAVQTTLEHLAKQGIRNVRDMGITAQEFTPLGTIDHEKGATDPSPNTLGTRLNNLIIDNAVLPDGRLADDVHWTSSDIILKRTATNPEDQSLLDAVHFFLDQPGVRDARDKIWFGAFSGMFIQAKKELQTGTIDMSQEAMPCSRCEQAALRRLRGEFEEARRNVSTAEVSGIQPGMEM